MGLTLTRDAGRKKRMPDADDSQIVIPLLAEEVSVAKRQIVTGRVEVATLCREREGLVDELLSHEDVEIERTPVGKTVEQAPRIREEGDTIIIPVVEEILVVERRLLLKEEVRVRRVRRAERHRERVNVRRQDVVVTRHLVAEEGAAEGLAAGFKKQTPGKEK
jgi:uncharacterized protein (TIGR02271 family)